MQILSNILAFLFAAGIIIFVHELGHYLVGKACGVRILTFSLGFGKRVWGFRRGDTDYRIALIPLGGFVSFAGQDPSEPTDDPQAFVNQPRWQRVLILLAGPAMNLLLAIALVSAVYMAGTEIPNQRDVPTEVGRVLPDSPGAEAGLEIGDRILSIDGEPAADWEQVSMAFVTSPEREVHLVVSRDGVERSLVVVPEMIPRYELGFVGVYPAAPPRVAGVLSGTPADAAGFRFGDALLAVDGRPVAVLDDFSRYVSTLAGKRIEVEIERDGKRLVLPVTPAETEEGKGAIGIYIREFHYARLPPVAAVGASWRWSVDTTYSIFEFVGKIFERRISAQSALGGPIQIAAFSGAAARSGFKELLLFMALISLNLYIINLAPIPILDGGQILILLVESALRRDLSLQIKERMTQVGLVLIVMLMAMALYFDLLKSLPGLGGEGAP